MNTRRNPLTALTRKAGLALGALALAAAAGCASAAADNSDAVREDGSVDLSKVTITVGDQKGGSKALLQASGALDELPYKVKWKEFTSGPPLMEALNAGSIDIGGVGNTRRCSPPRLTAKIVVVAGDTMGAKGDTIVVPQGFQDQGRR